MPTTNQKRVKKVVQGKQNKVKAKSKAKPQSVSAIGKALRSLGGVGGTALGSLIGVPGAGGMVGNSLGAALSKWMGFGDYVVKSNSVVTRASTGIPMMHKEGQTVTIRHREFIAQVKGSINFTVQDSYILNPGIAATFPWLSTVASSFQEYRFKGVVFHYIPSSGAAISGTNGALGTVMLQTSYRSNDIPPVSKTELLNEYWSGESVPADTFAHPIECDPNENPFNIQYVRTGDLPVGESSLLYDLGVTHLCTSGQQATGNTVGDLWVTYEVELKKPVVFSNVTSTYLTNNTWFLSPSSTALFSGTPTSAGNVTITGSPSSNALTILNIRGSWLLTVVVQATTTFTYTAFGVNAGSNYTVRNMFPSPSTSTYSSNGTTAHISAIVVLGFTVVDPSLPVVVTYSPSTFTGSIAATGVVLTQA
jgi:hypothetical protein